MCYPKLSIGEWRSLVAHLHGVQGAAGSNPVSPIPFRILWARNRSRVRARSPDRLDLAPGPGLDKVVGDGQRLGYRQLGVRTLQRAQHLFPMEPPHVGHLLVVHRDLGGHRVGMAADHQRGGEGPRLGAGGRKYKRCVLDMLEVFGDGPR